MAPFSFQDLDRSEIDASPSHKPSEKNQCNQTLPELNEKKYKIWNIVIAN